jgi:amino acid transporter
MGLAPTVKRVLIGDPRASGELGRQTLPPRLGLPVFAADTLSSVAYATEETMVVLALAGLTSLRLAWPIALGVAVLMAVVIAGYAQTVRAYPDGGGAYRVARRNLGEGPGLVAAAALLVDYVLTVAVSIAAGTAAIISAFPELAPGRLVMALTALAVLSVLNLRGTRESGAAVALPVYAFLAVMGATIATGLLRCVGGCPEVPFDQVVLPDVGSGLTAWLLLRAVATSATSLAGVEAVSNGVAAFRPPAARNAARTLLGIGCTAIPLLLGVAWLAAHIPGVVVFEGVERTVTSQIAAAVYGPASPGFYAVQVATAAILFLAANTGYADFPRLASALADDHHLPAQLARRGDRLVFSNGILVLTGAAAVLLVGAGARVTSLVGAYVVGVFTAFTLSQSGMVVHWHDVAGRRARASQVLHLVGALATSAVLVVVLVTKFRSGAWVVVLVGPALVWAMRRIRRHHEAYEEATRPVALHPHPRRPVRVVVFDDRVDAATAAALAYAYGIGAVAVEGVLVPTGGRGGARARWRALAPDVEVREPSSGLVTTPAATMRAAAREAAAAHPESFTVAVVPEIRSATLVEVARRHPLAQRAKAALVSDASCAVANVVAPVGGPGPYQVVEPVAHHVVVLVDRLHRASLRAVAYAESLQATSVQGLAIDTGERRSRQLLADWVRAGMTMPLDVVDSPYRSLLPTLLDYLEDLRPDGQHTVVTVVMGEYVLARPWQRALHGHTALAVKRALLFERGVVATSVPSRLATLDRARPPADPAAREAAGDAPARPPGDQPASRPPRDDRALPRA